MPTGDPLTDRARDLLLAHPHLSVSAAWSMAMEHDPDAARRWHDGEADDAPPAASADAAGADYHDPGQLLMSAIGVRVAAGMGRDQAQAEVFAAYPAIVTAHHEGRLIPRELPKVSVPAAIEHFRATLTIHEQQLAGATIRNVEVFSTGSWNGKTYTVRDLDDMVDAFHRIGFVPPVKLGHGDENELAHGYVSRLWRVGDKLLADFSNVPPETVALIRAGRLMTVSAEVYLDLDRGGQRWRRALRAVALLGSNPPGVSNLKPLAELLPAA